MAAFLTSLYGAFKTPPTTPAAKVTLDEAVKSLKSEVESTRDPEAMLKTLDRQFDIMLRLNSRLFKASQDSIRSTEPKAAETTPK